MLNGIKGAPFNFEQINNVKLWCSSEIAGYVIEKSDAETKEQIETLEDGAIILTYPMISKYDLIKWVLAEGGNMKVLAPEDLKNEVKAKAEKVSKLHQ